MKTKTNPFRAIPATAFAVVTLAMSCTVFAQSWDGGGADASWGTAENWDPNGVPGFTTSTDLVFNNLIKPDNDIGASRTIRSIAFGADMDGPFTINNRNFTPGGAAQQLTFQADSGNATLSVDAGATGAISIGWSGVGGSTVGGAIGFGSNLDIIHNGSGNLTFSRGLTGANGFTKTGTGTMVVSNFPTNNFTGAANFNGGRAIFGHTDTAVANGDFSLASAVNFGGGTLEIRTTHAKTISPSITVSAASTLAYNNTSNTNGRTLTLSAGNPMVLNGNLTVQNFPFNTTLDSAIANGRNMTGTGSLILESYNNVTSSSPNFNIGRLAINGDNTGWSGVLEIRKGTVQVWGNYATATVKRLGTGGIVLGSTGDSFGAGLLLTADNGGGNKTYSNNITVRSGGFRTIRGGSDHSYTFSGNVTLEGDLNVHNGLFFTDKSMILDGNISGAGGLSITESGNPNFVRLTGNNTYSGATTIGPGAVLNILSASGNAIGDSSPVTFGPARSVIVNLIETFQSSTLQFNSTNETVGSIASSGTDGAINLGANTLTTGGDNANTSFGGAISGSSASGLTKVGNGTFTLTGINTLTGAINVSAGTLVAGRAGNADISTTSAVNLNGGNLVFQPSAAFDKTYNGGINVNNAGLLSYDNPNNTTHTLTLGGANLALSANLTVKNTSDVETLVNPINISRLITGSGDLIVDTYNNIDSTSDNFSLGRVSLSGNNTAWNGNLRIARGTVSMFGDSTTNAPGNGSIIIGTDGDTFGAGLTFFTSGANTYANNITVNPGGFRAIKGGSSDFNITFAGNMTLNGNLTVDHFFPSSDRRINLNGPISGSGGLTVTRAGGSTETTLRMAGANTYSGGTTVANSASLSLASTASLASNVLVQAGGRIGGPGTISANLTLEDTANFFFYAVGATPGSYTPMTVNGTVTLNNNFSVANIVGGSRGEPVAWDDTPDGTYTLIGSTQSSLSNIQNFGAANYATIPVSATNAVPRYAYFQGTTGLQIVVSSTPPIAADPFTTWSGGAAFNDDANNDGIGNGLAFLLGAADVNANANSLLPVPTQSGGALTLTFKMRDLAARGAALLQVQHSSDLGVSDPWSTLVTVPETTSTVGGVNFTVSPGVAPFNNVTATIPAAGNAANGRLFGRVKSNP